MCGVVRRGKDCVAIASDTRLGIQAMTVATDFQKVFKIHDYLYLGMAGLATDVQTLDALFQFKHNMFALRENRNMSPSAFLAMVSSTLYSKRFGPYFVEPVVAGLTVKPDGSVEPYVGGTDLIGCISSPDGFAVSGTMSEALYGPCESMYKPDLEPEGLFETISQCMLAGVDRDAVSGWGVVVHIITKDEVITRHLKNRMD